GLLLLPRLWEQRKAMRARHEKLSIGEVLLRLNYTASITWCSVGLLVLLIVGPTSGQLGAGLLGAVGLPYFACQAADPRYLGYQRTDAIRVYGFNLLLLPVNLAGVFNSLIQAVTGEKGAFGRTPKV